MDAKGRAELGGVMMRGSGLAPTLDGTDLTSLQVGEYLGVWATVACHGVCGVLEVRSSCFRGEVGPFIRVSIQSTLSSICKKVRLTRGS